MDELELRTRWPEVPWDQPVRLTIAGHGEYWACRYCIALRGVKAQDVILGERTITSDTRAQALDHIEKVHHD